MATIKVGPWQFAAINNPFDHFCMYGGVATGKTYTGSHFAIKMMREHPELTGLIGANTYDQLTQATLRELFYWLEFYGYDYVIDCMPPASWGQKKKFKSYKNILSVKMGSKVVTVFTRVMSDGNPLRGVEFSWYWLDESRDTPEDTHNTVIARMRESEVRKGLITTTTNGEDWSHQRFVRGNDGSRLYGSMHVPTKESLKAGIITQPYFNTLLKSYSPLVAAQELDALHVNVLGGRAYYAAGEANKLFRAPWGDLTPSHERPLVIGCDFNFQPAPCIWMVGQVGPPMWGPKGEWWPEHIHWFGELAHVETSTRTMTQILLSQFPGHFYQVFGDMSGNQGTTSNAGETDFNQIADELANAGAMFSIDAFQADEKQNPRVKARVENMNARFKNAAGEIRQTYNPFACPNFDGDVRVVGWKPNLLTGKGQLHNADDVNRTHATDGAGYAVYKLFPPGRAALMAESVASPYLAEVQSVIGG